MIKSVTNYSKKKRTKKQKKDRQNPRTIGKSRAIQTKITQRSIHIHTQKKRKREKDIYIVVPKVHLLNLG